MVIAEARKIAEEEILPSLAEGDKEGGKLIDSKVHVPKCFHRAYIHTPENWIVY
jgi:hypothetical protein